MNVKKILVLLVFIGILGSCKKDDNGPEATVVPPRLLADQTIDDDAAIKAYLQTHFYNYQEFEDLPEGFDFKITIDSIFGVNSDKTPLLSQVKSEIITVSSAAFGLSAEENDIQHTLYYLNTDTGAGAMPTAVDSVYLKYEGFRLDGTVFDSNLGSPVWLDLQGTLSAANPGTIRGFKEGLPKFKAGGDITINDDGTFEVNNPGVGLIFMPSGLAYFGGAQPGETYSPLIFSIELLVANTADHDRDGVPSIEEDLNKDGDLFNDNTDEDNDPVPNYLDTDDDNDGTLTIDEDLEPDTDLTVDRDGDGDPTNDLGDGNPLNDDTDGDGIPNFLDTDDTASRKGNE